ncbi:MAG TPA: serine--tRNA ligase, partial [Euryarchaeota archaeon]|nr:serine--tRNA ligase [Euryarchaeota archaeon]
MKFLMKASFELSGEIKDPAALKKHIDDARETLKKGVPKGEQGGEITSVEIGVDSVALILESGRHVRPHDAVLRIKKRLSQALGREQGIGVRRVTVESYETWYP